MVSAPVTFSLSITVDVDVDVDVDFDVSIHTFANKSISIEGGEDS